VPAARVLRGDEMFDDPWLNEQRFFQDIDDPTWGHIRTVRSYATWSRSTGGFPCRAPLIGEHTLEILREFGLDASRVAALFADGVIAQAG
jgi:crotonobetainyl-CoA:carnitine CoA-transferase CaiB-like acyl-CoA transferase